MYEGKTPSTPLSAKLSSTIGIVAAMMLAVMSNIYVARHYKRWDVTSGGLYSLSPATRETLHSLEEPIRVYVLLSNADPLSGSVRQLLEAYQAETPKIELRVTDPDKNPAEFLAVQQRFAVVAGKTEDGRIVTDAPVIVTRGDVPHFISARELVEVEDDSEGELRTRPRIEKALTGAIRSLVGKDRPRACFTSGHGERSLDVGGSTGIAPLRDRLVKNNFEVVELPSRKAPADPERGEPKSIDIHTCRLLILAGPTLPFPPEDISRMRGFVERGGSALIAVNQEPNADDRGYLDLNLDGLLSLAGLKLDKNFIFELDPKLRSVHGFGETFTPILKPHPITEGLLKVADSGLAVVVTMTSSLSPLPNSTVSPVPLLMTSDRAIGMSDFFTWAKRPAPPEPSERDQKGPLTLGYAVELAKPKASQETHGPRMLVLGSSGILAGANWTLDDLRGTAVFVESGVSWLTARPPMLDIPDKPSMMMGLRVSEDSLSKIFRYVVVFMPLASALIGVALALRRRGSERPKSPSPAADAKPPSDSVPIKPPASSKKRAKARGGKARP